MPASITDSDLYADVESTNETKSGSSLDVIYLVKNISFTHSPILDPVNSLPWGSDTDLAIDTSLEASTPQCQRSPFGKTYKIPLQRKLNATFEGYGSDCLFDFQGDVDNKGLSTPDPTIFRAALRSFGSRSTTKSSKRREDFSFHRGLMSLSSDSGGLLEDNDVEAQFDWDLKSADVSDDRKDANITRSKTDNGEDEQSVENCIVKLEDNVEVTPKMDSYIKKSIFQEFMHARTPRPKRTLPRKKASETIASFRMLDFSNLSAFKKSRLSIDVEDVVCGRFPPRAVSDTSIYSARHGVSRRLSGKDYPRKDSDRKSDGYYASYLDYAEFSRAGMSSPVNDCPFESLENIACTDETNCSLETIKEVELDVQLILPSNLEMDGQSALNGYSFSATSGSVARKAASLATRRKRIPSIECDLEDMVNVISLSSGVAALAAQFSIHRPMSIQPEIPLANDTFSIAAKLTSTVGCKVLENAFVPAAIQAIIKSEIARAMGNGNSRAIAGSKFLHNVGKKHTPSRSSKRRRYGPREVHKNVWRLERKTAAGELGKDMETVDTFMCACTIL